MKSVQNGATNNLEHFDFDPIEPMRGVILIYKICGLWPVKYRFRNLYLIYALLFQTAFTFAFFTFKILNFYFKTNMDQVTVIIFEVLAEISCGVRVINFVANFESIYECLRIIKLFKCISEEELEYYKKQYKIFAVVWRFYLGCASFACLFSLSAPFFSEKPMLAYPAWYPLDWENNRLHFWIAYLYQLIGILCLAHTLVLLEVYHLYVLYTIGIQLDLLAQRLREIGRKDMMLPKKIRDEKIVAFFVANIKSFEIISSLIDRVESLFDIQFFYQFICSAIIFCVTAFKIMTLNISEELFSLAFYLSFSATMMSEIFLPCYFGNEVTLKREKLSFAIYSSDWFEYSHEFKVNMILFLEGLKRVRILKSGKIFTLSLFSFLTVINRSYSLFAVLRTIVK